MLGDKPPDPASVVFYEARGCDKCSRTGYSGRKAIYEVYRSTPRCGRSSISYGGDIGRLRAAADEAGMWTMRASGFRKVLDGPDDGRGILSVTTSRVDKAWLSCYTLRNGALFLYGPGQQGRDL